MEICSVVECNPDETVQCYNLGRQSWGLKLRRLDKYCGGFACHCLHWFCCCCCCSFFFFWLYYLSRVRLFYFLVLFLIGMTDYFTQTFLCFEPHDPLIHLLFLSPSFSHSFSLSGLLCLSLSYLPSSPALSFFSSLSPLLSVLFP